MRARPRANALALIASSLLFPAFESLRADEVVLTNGNQMTGTVRSFTRGELRFRIAGVGTVDIDWGNVEALSAEERMDVELASGERLQGRIASPSPGRLAVTGESGSREVEMADVVRLQPIPAQFVERTTGSVDFGFGWLGAHDERDLTLNAAAEHRLLNYSTEASINILVRELDGERAQDRKDVALASRRFLRNRWFVIGQLGIEDNQALSLDSRRIIGIAAGRTLVQTNRTVVSLFGGVDYAVEKYDVLAQTERSPEAMGALEWDWFDIGGDTTVFTKLAVFDNLDRDRTLVQLDATLHREFFQNFYWSLTFYEIFDNDAPEGADDEDYGVTVGIGRNF